jgi:hypothetical protein
VYPPGRSPFSKCALASGLVTQADIEQAEADLRAFLSSTVAANPAGSSPTPANPNAADPPAANSIAAPALSERRLADKLVEMGRINSFQAVQLLNGRTKFDLGPYRMLDSIGQGGMGEVYKAEHRIMGQISKCCPA